MVINQSISRNIFLLDRCPKLIINYHPQHLPTISILTFPNIDYDRKIDYSENEVVWRIVQALAKVC